MAEIVPQKQLVAALQGDPASCALIVYDRPAAYLCQRMIDKIPPIDALAEWKDSASTLVDVLRTYRNRVWLIDLDMLAQYPSVLGERLGLSAATSNMLKKELPPAQDPVLRMLAGALVRREIPAQILAGELEASALNLSNRDRTDAVDGMQAFEHYAQQRDKLEAANTESVAQTLYAEEIFSQLEVAQAETAALRAEFDAAQAEITAQEAKLNESRLTQEKMKQRQAEMDSELARVRRDGTAHKTELEAAQAEITAQEAKLNESRLTQEKMKQRQAEMDSELARVR
ncbi:hypothetical protein, partial [Sulfitobacter sp.]|uniref:hypothetical protein n=1 Tax=Sulfitobacter sp. TaxID=1903071 RepID=UPI003EF7B7DD